MKYPYRLHEAKFLADNGMWDMSSYRMTPHWLVEQVKFIWHLQSVADKTDIRKSKG